LTYVLIYGLVGILLFIPFILVLYYGYVLWFKKSGRIWLIPYLKYKKKQKKIIADSGQLKHIIFIFVDHFEPFNEKASKREAWDRVKFWLYEYPNLIKGHQDADGRPPQHTWFYPCEQDLTFLADLSKLCFRGLGEVEIHLHHHNDTSERLTHKLERYKSEFSKRGANITAEQTPKMLFGFIHGNWALDNSHPRGLWCGVNDEITILQKAGCYADFTLPSVPSPTQTKKINSIYYAKDNPHKPKSHNDGKDARVGFRNRQDFLIIQGPLAIYKNQSNGRWRPVIENGEISNTNPPTKKRIDEWIKTNIHIEGRPEWIFVKVHTHGAHPRNREALFGKQIREMFTYLETHYNDGNKYKLHYVTSREAYNIIKAAEDNKTGDPAIYRDYIIPPYANTRIKTNVLYELISYSKTWLEIKNLQPYRKCIFWIKKGQLEKIEGYIARLKLVRSFENKTITLTVFGNRMIYFNIRTSRPIRQVDNGVIIHRRKMRGFFISSIKSFIKPNETNEIVIQW